MTSDEFQALLFVLPNLQNLDFYLTAVPDDKINRKEEKEMEQTFRLKEQNFNFDKKGMILKGVVSNDGQRIFVRAWDIYLNNKDIMSDEEVEICFINGSEYIWCYKTRELKPLETIKLTLLEYEMLKFVQKQGAKYIYRNADGGEINISGMKPECRIDEWYISEPKCVRIRGYLKSLFKFVKWEDNKYYVIEDVLNNCEVIENV